MNDLPKNLNNAAKVLLEACPPKHDLYLQFGSWQVQVRTNEARLVSDLATYYEPFVCEPCNAQVVVHALETPALDLPWAWEDKQPDPGKTKIKEAWVTLDDGRAVKKRLTGMTFLFGGDIHLAVGPCVENSNQVINFINNRHIQWRLEKGALLGHAAGVAQNGRGLALAGFSGAGKSTLALHIMSRGADFVSNDRLMVENGSAGLVMHGVAKLPRINPGTALNNPDLESVMPEEDRERFSQLPKEELWNLEHKYDAFIDKCFGEGRFHLSAPMDGLFILRWDHSEAPLEVREVDLEDRQDLLPAFMKATGLFYLPPDSVKEKDPPAQDYIKALKNTRVIELSGGVDFDKASEIGMHFLQTGGLPA